MLLPTGASFARYTVEASLGGGGMGHVYRAFDTQLERRVALKILHVDAKAGKEGAARAAILREARAAAALNHVNAVTVFEVGEHEGVPFLAMELVTGASLRNIIGRPDVPLGRKLRWLLGIAEALSAAHAAGIVHLDVKPENVIVRVDDVVKVLDFGIARRRTIDPETFLPAEAGDHDLAMLQTVNNAGGAIVGTPRYMAPEQVGGSTLDGRTDQFAWGAVAYELLSGQSPWPPGEDLYALLSAIVRTKPAPLRSLRSDVPESVAAIVERALSKPREDRFGSMAEVAAAMGAAMAELSPSSLMSAVRSDLLSLPMASSTAPTLGADDVNAVTVEAAAIEVSARVSDPGRVSGPPSVRVAEGPATQRSGEVVPEREAVGERRARAGFWRAAQLLMVAAAASAAVWFFLTRGRPSEVASGETIANGCSEKAQRTYSSGTRALRNGDWQQARKHFQETVTADPECAAAHARLVVIGYWTDPPSRTRDELRRATDLREGLSERDRDLLHCYESVLWKAPPDEREFAACLDALSEARPRDAELAYIASDFSESPARMRELAQRALDIDPQYSDAWQGLAVALSLEEKETEALDALQKCVDKTVTSLDCLAQRALLQRRMGQCTELEGTARIWMTRSPQATGAHYTLASALAAQGRPRALVEEALVARWAHLAGSSDAREEPLEHAALDALFGDLTGARERAQELFERSKGAADADERINAALWLLDLAVELGATEAAGALAEDLWNRKAAWDSASRHKGFNAKGATFEPQLLRVLSIAKRMAGEAIAKEQKRWIASVQAVSAPGAEGLWVLGSAIPAETPEAAAEAVRSMPASIVSSWSWTAKLPGLVTFAYAGRALLLAGRTDDAVRLLRRATAACAALEDPVLHTQAHLWLGQALAKKGEREAACAAFSVVTARWGQAAESLSARAAADESKALGCAP